jgi:hypothetical protein
MWIFECNTEYLNLWYGFWLKKVKMENGFQFYGGVVEVLILGFWLDWKKGLCKREEICLLESVMVVELDERETREREGLEPWSCKSQLCQWGQATRVAERWKKKFGRDIGRGRNRKQGHRWK